MATPKPLILIVDDESKNRILLEAMLKPEGYLTISACDGEGALASVEKNSPDLILLDVMMAGMDGYQVAGKLKDNPASRHIPIIMLTSLHDRGARLAGLNAGVEEFLTKPIDRAELWVRVRNLLRLKEYSNLLSSYNRALEEEVVARTKKLRDSHIETIFAMTRAAEHKDEDTGAHVQRISHYAGCLAEAVGMNSAFVDTIFYASPMHDIGKIGIPDHILLKTGKHTAEEWEIMKNHCVLGAKILSDSESPYLKMGAEIAWSHHERWDGTGYPRQLKGEDIPLSARIMAVCDVYDALRSKRPYKPAFDHERALQIITQGDGRTGPGHFDPALLGAFAVQAARFSEIYEEHERLLLAAAGGDEQ